MEEVPKSPTWGSTGLRHFFRETPHITWGKILRHSFRERLHMQLMNGKFEHLADSQISSIRNSISLRLGKGTCRTSEPAIHLLQSHHLPSSLFISCMYSPREDTPHEMFPYRLLCRYAEYPAF